MALDTKYYINNSINVYSGKIKYNCFDHVKLVKKAIGKPINIGEIGYIIALEHFSDYEYIVYFGQTKKSYKMKQEYLELATEAERILYGCSK